MNTIRQNIRAVLLVSCLGAATCVCGGQPKEFALDDALLEALRHNAQLQSMQAKADAMGQRPASAGALPNPMFKYSGMDAADGGKFPNTMEKRFMVEQEFPWSGKRGLRENIAKKDAEAMVRDFDAATLDVVMAVKEAYFELRATRDVIAITRNEEDILRRVEKSAEAMNVTGQRSQQDVLKAQTEIAMLKPNLLALAARETELQSKLNELMNRDPKEPVGTAVTSPRREIAANVELLIARAEKLRPEVLGAQTQIERAGAEHSLMAKESRPDYRLGIEYRSIENDADQIMFTVGFDLPFWHEKNHALVRESAMMIESGKSALESAQRQAASETLSTFAKLDAALKTLDLYRTDLIPLAEATFHASESAYQTGKVEFFELLESERSLLNVRTMAAMAEAETGMQFARLERAVGTDLNPGAAEGKP